MIGGGKRQFHAKTNLADAMHLEYECGDLVLVDCRGQPGYEKWPHIGEVSFVLFLSLTHLYLV